MAVVVSAALHADIKKRSELARPGIVADMERMYAAHMGKFSRRLGLSLSDEDIAVKAKQAARLVMERGLGS